METPVLRKGSPGSSGAEAHFHQHTRGPAQTVRAGTSTACVLLLGSEYPLSVPNHIGSDCYSHTHHHEGEAN